MARSMHGWSIFLSLGLLVGCSGAGASSGIEDQTRGVPRVSGSASQPSPEVRDFPGPQGGPKPKILQPAEVMPKVDEVSKLSPASGDFIVDGEKRFDGWYLKTDRLVFKQHAKLIFSKQAQDARRTFFIVANEIVVEDSSAPGIISWERPPSPQAAGAGGQAPTGGYAPGDDRPGGRGAQGASGGEGLSGASAPALVLVTLRVSNSGPMVDLQGQKGGIGSQGQKGGDGGTGGKGHPATASAFDCRNGAGNGGAGGPGGDGGTGGKGGVGGNGGAVTILSLAENLPTYSQRFRMVVSAGEGGDPGPGGPGGNGGHGGDKGAPAAPYCKDDGQTGATGATGNPGTQGSQGKRGVDGDFFVGVITAEQFKRTFVGS